MLRLRARDLNKLLKHLVDSGYSLSEGPHAILHDGSEVGYWTVMRGGEVVGEVIAHYVDNHYYALMKTEGASDREVLEALVRADRAERWRAPVEDVLVIGSEELVGALVKYVDEVPNEEAAEALAHYESTSGVKVIERLARRLEELARSRGPAPG